MNYEIGPAQIDDGEEIGNVVQLAIPGYPFESASRPYDIVQDILRGNDYRVVARTEDRKIQGTAVLGTGHCCEVKRVAVHPAFRQNGLASAMAQNLAARARAEGRQPWADVRGDQIGMQRAALKAGMYPVGQELAKHVVYKHPLGEIDLGAARETMIHMSSLMLSDTILCEQLAMWPNSLIRQLVENIQMGLNPKPKDQGIVSEILPSPQIVRQRVSEQTSKQSAVDKRTQVDEDIEILDIGMTKLLVVKPDASAFLLTISSENLGAALKMAGAMGLQVVTYYLDAGALNNQELLADSGMQPSGIRVWQEMQDSEPTYQIAWRKTMNHFDSCLHSVNIDPPVLNVLSRRLDLIKSYAR